MAQYDGSIKINTEIEYRNAKKELKALESSIEKTAGKIASLRSEMDALKDVQIPTQEYKEIESDISKAEKELQKLVEKQAQMQRDGKDSGAAWDILNQKIQATKDYIEFAREDMQQLVDVGKAFTLGSETEKYAEMSAQMEQLNQQMQSDTERQAELQSQIAEREEYLAQLRENAVVENQRIIETVERIKQLEQEIADLKAAGVTEGYSDYDVRVQELSKLKQEVKDYNSNLDKAKENYKRIGKAARDGAKVANKAMKSMNDSFKVGLKNILKYGLGIRSLYVLINKLRSAIKEGFSNLYNDANMTAFKNQVDSLRASLLTLKNTFAAAFHPLVEVAIPYIQKTIEYMTRLIDLIGQFMAAARGQKTYTKAIKQTTAALKDQNKTQNKQLSSLDKLNNFSSSSGGGADDGGAETMFEEVPVDNKILDFLQKIKDLLQPVIEYAEKLKGIFSQGFWDGLGDWEYRWESIKENITSIKNVILEIATNAEVLEAVWKVIESTVKTIGTILGSVFSMILTIIDAVTGGIAKFLEQNKDKIEEFIITISNIVTEINELISKVAVAIAYVFEAFSSEQAQQLIADILGIIFSVSGVVEFVYKLFRDLLEIVILPFIENADKLKTTLEGLISFFEQILSTIKQGLDETFDKLNEVYDEHFKPFFDSIANGLSDTVGKFLEFWNTYVQPILEKWAEKFDEVWKDHIQPMLNKFVKLLGKVADFLKVVWEKFLKPLIDWIIANVLPVILPIINGVGRGLITLFGVVADVVSGIIDAFGGIIDFLTGVFSGDWDKAWSGIVDTFKGIFNLIPTIIEGILNVAVNIINGLIGGINKISGSVGIPEIPKIPEVSIPRLAKGAVIPANREFLAVLGDQKHGTNIEAPLSTIEEAVINAIAKVNNAMGNSGGGQEINLYLTVECEGYKLIQLMKKLDGEYFKQTGKHAMA